MGGRGDAGGSLGDVLHRGLQNIRAKMAADTPCKNVSRPHLPPQPHARVDPRPRLVGCRLFGAAQPPSCLIICSRLLRSSPRC